MIKLLHEDSEEAQLYAAGALGILALNSQNQDVIRKEGGIHPLVKVLREGSREAWQEAAGALEVLAWLCHDTIREAGGIAPLVALLRDEVCGCAAAGAACDHAASHDRSAGYGPVWCLRTSLQLEGILLSDLETGRLKQKACAILSTVRGALSD